MPAQPTSPAREAIRGTVPKLAEISDTLIYGEVWERPGLGERGPIGPADAAGADDRDAHASLPREPIFDDGDLL